MCMWNLSQLLGLWRSSPTGRNRANTLTTARPVLLQSRRMYNGMQRGRQPRNRLIVATLDLLASAAAAAGALRYEPGLVVGSVMHDTIDYEGISVLRSVDATHTGEFMGVAPKGGRAEIRYMDFWKVADERIVDNWVMVDFAHVLRQLGRDPFIGQGWERFDAQSAPAGAVAGKPETR